MYLRQEPPGLAEDPGLRAEHARRLPDALPVEDAVSTQRDAGAARRDSGHAPGRSVDPRTPGSGSASRAEERVRALLHPPPFLSAIPTLLPDRHDLVLPDPPRARRSLRPRAAARGEGDGESRPDLPASTSRLSEQYWLYLAALMRAAISVRPSIFRDFTVAELFARGLPVSMTLGALALILAVVDRRHARHHRRLPPEQRRRLPGRSASARSGSRSRTSSSRRCCRSSSA